MPRTCSICVHGQRAAIEQAITAGTSAQKISALFRVSPDAVQRHKTEHIAQAVRQVQEEAAQERALDVVQQLKAINAASLHILHDARNGSNPDLALKAVDRIQRQIELQAKLLGELDERPQVNVLVSAEWAGVRATLLMALAPFPEARIAVAGALQSIETTGPAGQVGRA